MKMKTMKKLVVGGWLVAAGLCGTAWAASAADADFTFDSATGTITKYKGSGGDVEIPAQIGGVDVKDIGANAFYNNNELTGVKIPASVTNIGYRAFMACSSLENVIFAVGSHLKSMGRESFIGCGKLASVDFPDGCPLGNIGKAAFSQSGLPCVTIPASVTNIGASAFASAVNLTNVTFAAGARLETIGADAFNLTSMKELAIPASVKEIGEDAFARNEYLCILTFEEGSRLETIGVKAFRCCGLTNAVVIPASVKHIGNDAFVACMEVEAITFAEGSQLETIGAEAFYEFHVMTDFSIPASVTNIGDQAFAACVVLTNLTVLATTPPTAGKDLFAYRHPELRVHVPEGTAAAYKAAPGWSAYADLITDGTEPTTVEATCYAWNGTEVAGPLTTNAIPVTADMTTLESGWYVVQGQVSMPDHGLVVNGDAHLILCDEAKLVVTGAQGQAGIEVAVVGSTTNSLTIYGQTAGMGMLEAVYGNDKMSASIGGSTDHPDCGRIRIDGGHVRVCSRQGAGIGGGCSAHADGGHGGDITINGGTVTAFLDYDNGGAGIGGSLRGMGGSVTINDGHVAVKAADDRLYGAGIGAGQESVGFFTVTINGGTIDLDLRYENGVERGGSMGAGIGNGAQSTGGGVVTINGGNITSRSFLGAGIGTGFMCTPDVNVVINGGTVFAEGACVFADDCVGGAGIGGGSYSSGADVLINGGTVTAIAQPVEDDDGDLVWSSGIGAGYLTEAYKDAYGPFTMGTFALGPNTTATILSGMDTNGVEVTEVQAGDYGSLENPGWCTNCYVHIVAVCNPPVASDWAKLQEALTNDAAASLTCAAFEHTYADGTNFVKLLKDVVANTEVDTCLVIASGSRAVLDLNGMTLDRGLSALEDEGGMQSGHVISVFGELTVTDKGKTNEGRIAGGYGVECGGVAVGGSSKAEGTDVVARFVLEDGAIVGNKSSTEDDGCSGGVLVNNGEFLMRGGRIAENLGLMTGGVGPDVTDTKAISKVFLLGGEIVDNTGMLAGGVLSMFTELTIGGSVVVRDNKKLGDSSQSGSIVVANVKGFLAAKPVISATEPLSADADVRVNVLGDGFAWGAIKEPVEIIETSTAGDAQYFHSEIPGTQVSYKDGALWIEEGTSAPATVKIVSAKSARTEGAWSGAAEVVYELSNLKSDGRYALAFELTAAGQFGARTNEVETVVDGVYTQELFCTEFFGIESQVQDPAAELTLKLIEKSKAAK